jgi:hypothetical protein
MSTRAVWFFIACVALAFAGEAFALWHLRAPGEPATIPAARSHPLDLVGRR